MSGMRNVERSPGPSYSAAKPTRRRRRGESHHSLQCLPSTSPSPSYPIAVNRPGGADSSWMDDWACPAAFSAKPSPLASQAALQSQRFRTAHRLCTNLMFLNGGTERTRWPTFSSRATLAQDYDHHQDYYAPDVMRSKILRHAGDDCVIYLRFYKRKVITSVVDTQHEVHCSIVDATRAWSRSRTTRVQQVDDAGKPDERLRPVGQDDGFLWRMNTYWPF
jgi:hypothetical protein